MDPLMAKSGKARARNQMDRVIVREKIRSGIQNTCAWAGTYRDVLAWAARASAARKEILPACLVKLGAVQKYVYPLVPSDMAACCPIKCF